MSHASKNTLLSLDISSDLIKAAIVRRSKNGDLEVLGTGVARQLSGSMQFGEIFDSSAVAEACRRAIDAVEEASGTFARQVVANIAGESVKSTISRVHYTRSDSERIFSEPELSAIFEKIENAAKKKLAQNSASSDSALELLDSCLVSCSIDGRAVDTPIDLDGSDVVIEYYTSFVPTAFIDGLREVFSELKLELVSVSTTPFAIYRTLAPRLSKRDSAIYLDVDGDCSNLVIIEDGVLRGAETFSLGTKIISKDLPTWISGLKIALSDIPHLAILPPKLVLCGKIAESFEFQEYLALGNWFSGLSFDRRPMIQTFENSELPEISGDFSAGFFPAVCLSKVGFEDLDSIS